MNAIALEITPAMAQAWLAQTKTFNRPLRRAHAEDIAAAMKSGKFVCNGESIILDKRGNVVDGQHRLRACILAEVPFRSVVVFHADKDHDDLFSSIDGVQVRRSFADALSQAGEYPRAKHLASVARLVALAERDLLQYVDYESRHIGLTSQDIVDVVQRHPNLQASAAAGAAMYKKFVHIPAATWGFLHYWLPRYDSDAADTFLSRLADGVGLHAGTPVYVLRCNLQNATGSKRRTREVTLAIILKAWRDHVNGTPKKEYKWVGSSEAFPNPDPKK